MGGEEMGFSSGVVGEEKGVGLYPIYFGVSCAFAAVQMLAEKDGHLAETMLRGSAQLLGLLVWKAGGGGGMEERSELVEKVRKAELEVADLRRRRNEDAKANEKVVSIFAGQEQSWIGEKRRLRLQIQALANELRLVDAKNKQLVASLAERVKEKEEELEEEVGKRSELEERLQMAELGVEDMRETMKKDAQEHLSEIWKHKTAVIELVSNQRRLEAEMGRAIREAQADNKQLEEVVEQKQESDEMVKKVSKELGKLQKDAEQKDRILSAMLRKSKLDTSEKHVLIKEVKISKARRKQVELETERWKGGRCEARNGKVLRGFWGDGESFRPAKSMEVSGSTSGDSQFSQGSGLIAKALVLGSLGPDQRKEPGNNVFRRTSDGLHGENADLKELEDWARREAEKYTSIIEQRHYEEIDAFAEQMRLKDEKLEDCRWQLLSKELESKRLESQIEDVDINLSRIKEENAKLDALLMEKEQELRSLQEKFSLHLQLCKKGKSGAKFQFVDPVVLWSEVKIVKKKSKEKIEQEPDIENDQANKDLETGCNKSAHPDESTVVEVCQESLKELRIAENSCEIEPEEEASSSHMPEEEIEEEKQIILDPCHVQGGSPSSSQEESEIDLKLTSEGNCFTKKHSPMKMDLHALGISYKIKRLKQQLLLLEKTTGSHVFKKPNNEDEKTNDKSEKDEQLGQQMKEFFQIISFLTRQVRRYQTLEEKVDGLCQKMQETGRNTESRDGDNHQSKKEVETLTHFLEETFQVQRYMVATGQKLMEIQCKIASRSFLGGFEGIEEYEGFNMKQFADNIKKLFGDVQRGLEIRISKIIGDIEGTLACEGILQLRS